MLAGPGVRAEVLRLRVRALMVMRLARWRVGLRGVGCRRADMAAELFMEWIGEVY